jgi:hypothetical protein
MNSRPSADHAREPLARAEEHRLAADAAERAHGGVDAAGDVLAGFLIEAHFSGLRSGAGRKPSF